MVSLMRLDSSAVADRYARAVEMKRRHEKKPHQKISRLGKRSRQRTWGRSRLTWDFESELMDDDPYLVGLVRKINTLREEIAEECPKKAQAADGFSDKRSESLLCSIQLG